MILQLKINLKQIYNTRQSTKSDHAELHNIIIQRL